MAGMETTETKKPKILIFTMTSWNSKVGANTWESLVNRYNSEDLANIFLREETPDSKVCSKYFCISENRVIKSILKRKIKTGREVGVKPLVEVEDSEDLQEHNERYAKMKKKRRYYMLLARELCWKFGKWKTKELDAFLDEFKPDVILHGMDGYIHMNRIVRYAIKHTGAKAIGYIWDDNFTYKQSKKFGYKVYRYYQRKSLKKLAKQTDGFFAITPKTKAEADAFFGVNCTVLSKPLNNTPYPTSYENRTRPIRMLYTGNLLIGRDKSLQKISAALKALNAEQTKIVLDVYTQTQLSEEYLQKTTNEFCKIHPPIPQEEVLRLQKETDILLFLEDMSNENLTARLSFSTKITDYFSAGKCIFAIGNADLAPMQYFADTQSASIAHSAEEIEMQLEQLTQADVLAKYAQNAVACGVENHRAEYILKAFDDMIERVYKGE